MRLPDSEAASQSPGTEQGKLLYPHVGTTRMFEALRYRGAPGVR